MRKSIISLSLAALLFLLWPASAFAATDPGLGTAIPFSILAGDHVTNTGATTASGEVGVSPGIGVAPFIVALPTSSTGAQHVQDAVALSAENALTTAYNNSLPGTQPCPALNDFTNVDLGAGRTLVPGVYCQNNEPVTGMSGTLTLNGSGIYIFQEGSGLITASGTTISLIGGAQPCQVFWQVSSSATIGTNTAFVGTIMALTSITMQTGATLNGRALARNGLVALDTNTITGPTGCSGGGGGVVPGNTGVPADFGGGLPWLLVIGVGAGLAATAMGVSTRRRRRRTQ
jgi:hypothetical protein